MNHQDKITYHRFHNGQNFEQHQQTIENYLGIANAPALDLLIIGRAFFFELRSKQQTLAQTGLPSVPGNLFTLREIAKIVNADLDSRSQACFQFEDAPTDVQRECQIDVKKNSDLIRKLAQSQQFSTPWIKNEDVAPEIDLAMATFFTQYRTFSYDDFTAVIAFHNMSYDKRRNINEFLKSYLQTCYKDTTAGLPNGDAVHLFVYILERHSQLRHSGNIHGLMSRAISDYGVNDNSSPSVFATVLHDSRRSAQKLRSPIDENALLQMLLTHLENTDLLYPALSSLAVVYKAKPADERSLPVFLDLLRGQQQQSARPAQHTTPDPSILRALHAGAAASTPLSPEQLHLHEQKAKSILRSHYETGMSRPPRSIDANSKAPKIDARPVFDSAHASGVLPRMPPDVWAKMPTEARDLFKQRQREQRAQLQELLGQRGTSGQQHNPGYREQGTRANSRLDGSARYGNSAGQPGRGSNHRNNSGPHHISDAGFDRRGAAFSAPFERSQHGRYGDAQYCSGQSIDPRQERPVDVPQSDYRRDTSYGVYSRPPHRDSYAPGNTPPYDRYRSADNGEQQPQSSAFSSFQQRDAYAPDTPHHDRFWNAGGVGTPQPFGSARAEHNHQPTSMHSSYESPPQWSPSPSLSSVNGAHAVRSQSSTTETRPSGNQERLHAFFGGLAVDDTRDAASNFRASTAAISSAVPSQHHACPIRINSPLFDNAVPVFDFDRALLDDLQDLAQRTSISTLILQHDILLNPASDATARRLAQSIYGNIPSNIAQEEDDEVIRHWLHMRNADLHRDLSFILCSLDWSDDLKDCIYAALQVSLQLQLDTYLFDDQHYDDYDEYQDSYTLAYQQDLQLQDFLEQQCYSASATAFPRDFVEYDNHILEQATFDEIPSYRTFDLLRSCTELIFDDSANFVSAPDLATTTVPVSINGTEQSPLISTVLPVVVVSTISSSDSVHSDMAARFLSTMHLLKFPRQILVFPTVNLAKLAKGKYLLQQFRVLKRAASEPVPSKLLSPVILLDLPEQIQDAVMLPELDPADEIIASPELDPEDELILQCANLRYILAEDVVIQHFRQSGEQCSIWTLFPKPIRLLLLKSAETKLSLYDASRVFHFF